MHAVVEYLKDMYVHLTTYILGVDELCALITSFVYNTVFDR